MNKEALEKGESEYMIYSHRKAIDRSQSPINSPESLNKTPRSTSNITSPKSVNANSQILKKIKADASPKIVKANGESANYKSN